MHEINGRDNIPLQKKVLAAAFVMALLFHGLILLLLQQMQIFHMPGSSGEGLYSSSGLYSHASDDEEERSDQLEVALKSMFEEAIHIPVDPEVFTQQEPIRTEDWDSALPSLNASSEVTIPNIASTTIDIPSMPAVSEVAIKGNLDTILTSSNLSAPAFLTRENSKELYSQLINSTDALQSYFGPRGQSGRAGDGSYQPKISLEDPNQAGNIARSEDFILDLLVTPDPGGRFFYCQISLIPKIDTQFKRIRQNFAFLIDRSHSIDKDRYEMSKQAVGQALDYLKNGDSFNIVVFDTKSVKLSQQHLPWTPENVAKAKEFLAKQPAGGFFSGTELYPSLGDIIPSVVVDTEVNTCILFSDGDTYLSQQEQRRSIQKWTNSNNGKVSLYCITAGGKNNQALLELLASFNKGAQTHAKQYSELPTLVSDLVKKINAPIGKELVVSIVQSDKTQQIQLYPSPAHLPNLYEGVPYILVGTVSNLEDFQLFIQGKYYDKWLDIQQKISFEKAQPGNPYIARTVAQQQAYSHYENFLRDGKVVSVKEANRLLEPFNIAPAFR